MLKHLKAREDWSEKSLGAKGFTLIELLVVIVILGILAAVVVFAVSGITDRGQKSACATEGRTIRTAQEAHYAENGSYTDGATLASTGFLSKEPTLATTAPSGNTFTISPVTGSKCTQAELDG